MGEYYQWVNVDKKEYISPVDFGYGSKRWQTLHVGNDFNSITNVPSRNKVCTTSKAVNSDYLLP